MAEPLGRRINGVTIQHVLAEQAIQIYKDYDIAKVFSIVRNPIDRLISECNYYNRFGSGYGKDINSSVTRMFGLFHKHSRRYRDNHIRPQVDFIDDQTIYFKYEQGVHTAINNLFADIDGEIIDFNSIVNESKKRYNIEQLSDDSLSKIHEFYKEDFDRFEY